METKKCTKCGEMKTTDNFYKRKSMKDGFNIYCKSCMVIINENFKINNPDYEYHRYLNNKESALIRSNQYFKDNPNYNKEYRKNKRNEIRLKERQRYKNDPIFKLSKIIRININGCIKRMGFIKNNNTQNILGCSFEEFKDYIESKFEDWMSWGNYGNPKDGILEFNKTWDLDHIIPASLAKNEEELFKLNHFSNLQPLCSKYNREVKKDNIL